MEFQLRRSCILKPQHEPKIDQEIDMKPPSTSDGSYFLARARIWGLEVDLIAVVVFCAAKASAYIFAGRVTPSAVRIFVWLALGCGSFVTVVFSSILYCNRHRVPSEVSASRSVMACGLLSVVPKCSRSRRSISRLSFNASMQQNTWPRVRLSLRTNNGRTSNSPVFIARKSRSTFCKLT